MSSAQDQTMKGGEQRAHPDHILRSSRGWPYKGVRDEWGENRHLSFNSNYVQIAEKCRLHPLNNKPPSVTYAHIDTKSPHLGICFSRVYSQRAATATHPQSHRHILHLLAGQGLLRLWVRIPERAFGH